MAANVYKNLSKFLKLMRIYALMDWMYLTRGIGMFLMWTITDTVLNIASISGMLLLAARFSGIGQWSQASFVFMLGYAAVTEGLVNTFFNYNVSFISRIVGRGQLDHALIQPQPLWLSLLTQGFSPAFGIPTLVPGVGMMAWSLRQIPIHITLGWVAMLLLSFFSSVTVVMSFQFTWGSLAFWAPRAAEEINSATTHMVCGLKAYPLDGLSGPLRFGLLSIAPIGFTAWAPVGALLKLSHNISPWWVTPLSALAIAVPAALMFHAGLTQYGRTGSQRYSDFGHRS